MHRAKRIAGFLALLICCVINQVVWRELGWRYGVAVLFSQLMAALWFGVQE